MVRVRIAAATLLLLSWVVADVKAIGLFVIPGTTLTDSGYDTELGTDAICWKTHASRNNSNSNDKVFGTLNTQDNSLELDNPLVNNFRLNGTVQLLQSCPSSNTLTARAPDALQEGAFLRTGITYDFHVEAHLNLWSLHEVAPFVVSDMGPVVAVQVLLCELGRSGFCSPFVHDDATIRLAAARNDTTVDEDDYHNVLRGDRHGGTHVDSGFVLVELPPEEGPFYKINVPVPMVVNRPGSFFAVATLQVYMGSSSENVELRYDIANALAEDERLLDYHDPPHILEVPTSVIAVSYVAIAFVSLVILFLLGQTVKHRNHQVLKLTQGMFLIAFLVAALVATLSTFLLEPKSDAYCRNGVPIILCSLQFLYAVTLGRLWRINAVISPLLVQTLRRQKGWTHKLLECFTRKKPDTSKNLRKQIHSSKLAIIIALFTIPQIILQAVALRTVPQHKSIDLNSDESIGRTVCRSGDKLMNPTHFLGFICFALLILILLVMAHNARQLPSLFNETRDIFDSTLATFVIFILGGGIVSVATSPTTSPAVEYLVGVSLVLSITLNSSVRILFPKLRMIWRGETVLVSKLMIDHREWVENDDRLYRRKKGIQDDDADFTNAFYPDDSTRECTTSSVTGLYNNAYSSRQSLNSSFQSFPRRHSAGGGRERARTVSTDMSSCAHIESTFLYPSSLEDPFEEPEPRRRHMRRGRTWRLRRKPKRKKYQKVLVEGDETPSRTLVLKMVDLQNQLAQANDRIMSGVAVSQEDWEALRNLSTKLGSIFQNNVEFSWEKEQEKMIHEEAAESHAENLEDDFDDKMLCDLFPKPSASGAQEICLEAFMEDSAELGQLFNEGQNEEQLNTSLKATIEYPSDFRSDGRIT